jgi:hypothetical protein
MILQASETVIRDRISEYLQDALVGLGGIDVYISDLQENKNPMPYVLVKCSESEEQITPGSGIFRVYGEIAFRSHVKETSPEFRQITLDAINNFSYDNTAIKLSEADNFHCHGWHPMSGDMIPEPETKSYLYLMKYSIYCMARNNN